MAKSSAPNLSLVLQDQMSRQKLVGLIVKSSESSCNNGDRESGGLLFLLRNGPAPDKSTSIDRRPGVVEKKGE